MRVLLRQADYGAGPVSNFVMVADQHTGATHALYCHNYARVLYVRSDDDGENFSQPIDITSAVVPLRQQYPWRVIATGPGHGLQLRSGRMIVPLWMSDGSGTEFGAGRLGHRPSAVTLIYSDDHGNTWQAGDIVVRNEQHRNPSETVAVELVDGRVLFNIRTEADEHRRLVAISPDGVSGWSAPYFDNALLEPVCMASMIRCRWQMEDRPGVILFANPVNLEQTAQMWAAARDRKRLTVKLSYDDAATWAHSKVLEPGPAGYSDLAALPDGSILCLYESGGRHGDARNAAITLARFDINWVAE
jgi:sialidase-1